jgi:signal transduction histidine kinase
VGEGIFSVRRGLKPNIIFNLVVLSALAMFLIDLVMISTAQQEFIRNEVARGRLFLHALAQDFALSSPGDAGSLARLASLQEAAGYACTILLGRTGSLMAGQEVGCGEHAILAAEVKKTLISGSERLRLQGSTLGVFWKRPRHLLLAAPLYREGQLEGAVGVELSLEEIFVRLGKMQRVFFGYFLANLIVLALLGFFWFHRVMVRPIQSLVQLIEGFRTEEDLLLPASPQDSEFQQLSKALRRMVRGFGRNREELRATVLSLKKANAELRQAQDEIIRAEKLASVGRLSAGIAHEIGNPIGIVLGYIDLLKQAGVGEEERLDFLARAEKEVNRINLIIRQLLDLARPSKVGVQVVAVHDLLHELSQAAAVLPLMASISCRLDLLAVDDRVQADGQQLRQVFLNLLINAADALADYQGPAEKELLVTSTNPPVDDGESPVLLISFKDNGPGIPEEALANIFDPFYTTKEPGKGTGLGLAVSFMIVESIGGRIEVKSRLGQGSTLSILLPLLSGHNVTPEKQNEDAHGGE